MSLEPKLADEVFEATYASLQETASKILAIYKNQWDFRNDLAKTLLTVSSAVLVVSVSLSSHVTKHKWILGICWAALLLAIVTAVITLWFSLGLFTLPAVIFSGRKTLRQKITSFDVTKPHDEVSAIVDELVATRIDLMAKLDRRAIRTIKVSISMFLVGLLCTGIIGWLEIHG
jgi:hypothetical protein